MRVTVTGATGLIGARIVARLRQRGDEVVVLTRSPEKARTALPEGVEPVRWADPTAEPAPAEGVSGADAVIHLAGEPIAQRWSDAAKRRIRESRELGTRNLVAGMRQASPPPGTLVSASGVGYYGPRGDEPVPESAPPGDDFLAHVCQAWEREALAYDGRVVVVRTAVVLDRGGGALAKMLPFFRLGIGGPVAGGRQYMPWIHLEDLVQVYLEAAVNPAWSGPVNAAAPEPATNRQFGRALGRALGRPAFAPVPGFAVRLLFGEMAHIVVTGQRAVPARLQELGYEFLHPELESALRLALGR